MTEIEIIDDRPDDFNDRLQAAITRMAYALEHRAKNLKPDTIELTESIIRGCRELITEDRMID